MEQLRKQLMEVINNTQLPAEAIYYIVKDVYRDVNDVYQQMLAEARSKEEQSEIENLQTEQSAQ